MVPNRRLREVLDQAAQANRDRAPRRPSFEHAATVVPEPTVVPGIRIPDSSGPLFADTDGFGADEVLDIQTGDIEIEFLEQTDEHLLQASHLKPQPKAQD